MSLFVEKINNWDDWRKTVQSYQTFAPLLGHIFQKEKLPFAKIESLPLGMVAVLFKVGGYVIKIYSPPGINKNSDKDMDAELFGMKLANVQGVTAPKLIAYGVVEDKYHFHYIIMEHINGKRMDELEGSWSYEQKVIFGQNMRKNTDKLNVPCKNFMPFDVIHYSKNAGGWDDEGFLEAFKAERLAYIANLHINDNDKVLCHGDLHCHNVLVDDKLDTYIIDFASSMYSPPEYEQVYIASALFCFEKPYMEGYFGSDYRVEDIVDLSMTWLPVHTWGHGTIVGNLGSVAEITSFDILHKRLHDFIESEKRKPYCD